MRLSPALGPTSISASGPPASAASARKPECNAEERPTSLVLVTPLATSSATTPRCNTTNSLNAGKASSGRERPQRMIGAAQQEEMHRRQQDVRHRLAGLHMRSDLLEAVVLPHAADDLHIERRVGALAFAQEIVPVVEAFLHVPSGSGTWASLKAARCRLARASTSKLAISSSNSR